MSRRILNMALWAAIAGAWNLRDVAPVSAQATRAVAGDG